MELKKDGSCYLVQHIILPGRHVFDPTTGVDRRVVDGDYVAVWTVVRWGISNGLSGGSTGWIDSAGFRVADGFKKAVALADISIPLL